MKNYLFNVNYLLSPEELAKLDEKIERIKKRQWENHKKLNSLVHHIDRIDWNSDKIKVTVIKDV